MDAAKGIPSIATSFRQVITILFHVQRALT
jgi:hypothetical protein